jgi:hypothetical protein
MSIRLSTANRAAPVLNAAARRADGNRDGLLTTKEIHAARRTNGTAATKALLEYHAQHRAMTRNDPEIPSRDKANEMRHMDVNGVEFSTKRALTQLGRIDAYKGNARAGVRPNTADGVVTDAEIRNYGRTGGKLQLEARPFATFVTEFER